MDRNHDLAFISKHLFLRRPRVANFVDIIKIATTFIKITLKDSKKVKELEIIY